MTEWSTVALDQLIEPDRGISYGIVQPGVDVPDGIPIIRVTDIRDGRIATSDPLKVSQDIEANYSRTRLKGGELLLTLVGTVGEAAVVPGSLAGWNTARAVAVIPVRKDVGSYWVKLALQSPDVRHIINSRLNTTVQATLNLRDVAQLPISLPPPDVRRSIVHILGTLDDKIELNRRMNETLEAMARALFKSWFVDFDPVRAKMAGRARQDGARSGQQRKPLNVASDLPWPEAQAGAGAEGDPGLPKDIADLFPDRLVESELGEIPEGWEVRGLDTIALLDTASISPSAQPDEIFEHYSIPAFDAGAVPTYDRGSTIKSNKYVVSPGAVLVSKLNPQTPRVWLPRVKTKRAVCSTEFMQFVPRIAAARNFLYLMMSADSVQAEIIKRVTGSTGSRQRAQPSNIAALSVIVPRKATIETFDVLISPILQKIALNREESLVTEEIRNGLLPKLISGELRANIPKCIVEK